MLFDSEIQRLSQYLADGQEHIDWNANGSRLARQIYTNSDTGYYLVLPRAFRHEFDNFVSALEHAIGHVGRSKLEDQSLWDKSPAFENSGLGFLQSIAYYHEGFDWPTYTALFDAIVAWTAVRERYDDQQRSRLDQWCNHFFDTIRFEFIGHIEASVRRFLQMDQYEELSAGTHDLRLLRDNLCVSPSALGNECAIVAMNELTRCRERLV